MKKIFQILNRYHKQTLMDQKSYKRSHEKRMKALQKYKLDIDIKNEIDYYHVEMLIRTLLSKRVFEKIFFQVYTDMQDYWDHMNFIQCKQQIELCLKAEISVLPLFEWENQSIYLPCFNKRFNRIYRDELPMLNTKAYRGCIRDFKESITFNCYGYHRYVHGFTSLKEVYHRDDYDYVLYQPLTSCFYIFKNDQFIESIKINKDSKLPDAILHMIGKSILEEDIHEFMEVILMCNLVSKRCQKALLKYSRKIGVL